MLESKGKISVRQLMIIFIIAVYTPSARYLPTYVVGEAKQAAWLSPIITFIIFITLIYVSSKLFNKCKLKSYPEILNYMTSKFIGKVIVVFYILWVSYLLIWYVRYFGETLVSLVYPNINVNVFYLIMLYLVSMTVRSGIVVIARMSEVFFFIVTIATVAILALLIPNVQIDNITPISSMDIIPVFKGSLAATSLISITCFFFFSHEWSKKNEFLKQGIKAGIYILILETLIILASIGNLGHALISISAMSFWITVQHIELLGFLTGFESMLLSAWLLTDFIIITISVYSALNMFKSIFNLSHYKPFINIYLVIIYLFSWLIAKNIWELGELSTVITIYIAIVGGTLPIFIFLIGKIRGKV
ncbi:GerAB/ArcD/ProY family transporter [Mycoplasmatota bacterium WC44]